MTFKFTLPLLLTIGMLLAMGCGSGEDEDYIPSKQKSKATSEAVTQKHDYSIYLENSGSINGYLNVSGDGNFKDDVYSLITEISGFNDKKSLNLYDINTKVIPVAMGADATEVSDYIRHLDMKTFKERSKAKGGNQGQSDLSKIIKTIVDSTRNNGVSILISDCVFSPGKKQAALDFLASQRSNIQGYIDERLRAQVFSTLVLQFTSDFDGIYYDQNDTRINGLLKQRPYYMVCFGNEQALHQLLDYVKDQNRFKGFRDFLFLTNTKSYDVAPKIHINNQYYEYDSDNPLTITEAKTGGRDKKFRIILDASFSRLPVSEGYIKDRNNYIIPKGYAIDSISPFDKNGFSHQIILVSDKPQTGKIQISLKKQLPQWVVNSNLDSDSGLPADSLAGKTFGIRYLLEGMFRAYDSYTKSPDYFTFSISVKDK